MIKYLRKLRENRVGRTKDYYNVSHINNGYFLTKSNRPVFVYEIVNGVNLLTMENSELNDFIFAYNSVFNTLEENDSIQMMTSSRPLDPNNLMDRQLEKCRLNDDNFAQNLILRSQDQWLRTLAFDSQFKTLKFYILISSKLVHDDLKYLISYVQKRAMFITGNLNQCGLETSLCTRYDIKDYFDRELNPLMDKLPDEALDLSVNFDTKGVGLPSQVDALARDSIITYEDHLQFGSGVYSKSFFCETVPFNNWVDINDDKGNVKETKYIAEPFFHNILKQCGYFRFSLYAYGFNQDTAKGIMSTQEDRYNQLLNTNKKLNPDTVVALERTRKTIQNVAHDKIHCNKMSFYITLYARSLEELSEKSDIFKRMFNGFHLKEGFFEQDEYYESSLPFCSEFKDKSYLIPSDGLANSFPFISARVGMKNGILMGFDQLKEAVFFDPWDRHEVDNGLVVDVGEPGSGKSFNSEKESLLLYPENIVSCIFHKSTSHNYTNLMMGGQNIRYGDVTINMFDPIDPEELKTKPSLETVLGILGPLEIMLYNGNKMPQVDKSIFETAIRMTYKRKKGKVPLLEDLAESLDILTKDQEMSEHKKQLKELRLVLNPFIGDGIYASITNKLSNVDIHAQRVVVDLSSIPTSDKMLFNLAMFMCTKIAFKVSYIAEKKGIDKALIKFDETWAFITSEYGRELLDNLARRSRHLKLVVYLSTQYVADFNLGEEVNAFLRGAQSIFILKQPAKDRELIKKVFKFNERELDIIQSIHQVKGLYSQCFAVTGKRRGLVNIMSNPHIYWAATSEPNHDVPLRNKVFLKHTNADGEVDYVSAINELVSYSEGV